MHPLGLLSTCGPRSLMSPRKEGNIRNISQTGLCRKQSWPMHNYFTDYIFPSSHLGLICGRCVTGALMLCEKGRRMVSI